MGCISSVPHENNPQPNIDSKQHIQTNENVNTIDNDNRDINNDNDACHPVNANFECNQIIATNKHDKKTLSFIKKYKLESLSSSIYNEGITVDFLLSQNTNDISLIANKLINNNIIQQKKFIYAVTNEKQFTQNKHAKSNIVSKTDLTYVSEMKEITEHGSFRVYITNPYNDKDSLPLFVCSTDTISNVLYAFQKRYKRSFLNLPLHKQSADIAQILTYCGTEMLHNKPLAHYKVIPESELCLTYKFVRFSKINHKRAKRTKSHTHSKSKSLSKYKSKSKSYSYTYTNAFVNTYSNTYSNSYKEEGVCLNYDEKINVYIKHKKCVLSVMLCKQTKIKKLKHKIEKQWGIAARNQILNYNGMTLSDLKCINDYSIEDNGNIYLTKKIGLYSVDISVCYKDKLISIDLDRYDTIKCIKMQIQYYLNIEFDKQRLIYLNKELSNDNATVKSVNICDGVVLYLQSD